ncbi:MAG: hypothetical protein KY445_11275 [Armatimonadetes bacterium]|nr:hypothetical protein [Armatimonadota bacterium]
MGLDLTLLPFDGATYSQTVLPVVLSEELAEMLMEVERKKGRHVPETFNSYLSREGFDGCTHYGRTTETPYGELLKSVQVKDLLKCWDHPNVLEGSINRAAWAYLSRLENDTPVALFWS